MLYRWLYGMQDVMSEIVNHNVNFGVNSMNLYIWLIHCMYLNYLLSIGLLIEKGMGEDVMNRKYNNKRKDKRKDKRPNGIPTGIMRMDKEFLAEIKMY